GYVRCGLAGDDLVVFGRHRPAASTHQQRAPAPGLLERLAVDAALSRMPVLDPADEWHRRLQRRDRSGGDVAAAAATGRVPADAHHGVLVRHPPVLAQAAIGLTDGRSE